MRTVETRRSEMWRTALAGLAAVALAGFFSSTPLAQAVNPAVGSWKLNIAKSKYTAGTPTTNGNTRIDAAGTGVKVTIDNIAEDGTTRRWTYTTTYDGSDVPITGNCQYGDAVSVTRLDANTTRQTYKAAGKVTTIQTSTVSADGKTRTVTSKGIDARGQAVDSVAVYDKQ